MKFLLAQQFCLLFLPTFLFGFLLRLSLPEENAINQFLLELGGDSLKPVARIAEALADKEVLEMAVGLYELVHVFLLQVEGDDCRKLSEALCLDEGLYLRCERLELLWLEADVLYPDVTFWDILFYPFLRPAH